MDYRVALEYIIDIDEIIEEKLNSKLRDIVDDFGEDGFLKIEEQTVLKLGKHDKFRR